MSASEAGARPARSNLNLSSARPWQVLFLALGFVLFLAGLTGALYLTTRTDHIRTFGRHHSDVLNTTRDLMSGLLDCEAGQRGYLLTHDERYLEPYFVARVTLKAVNTNLTGLTAADTEQAARVAVLSTLVDAKIGELEQTVNLEQRGEHERAMAVVKGDSGRQLTRRFREAAAAIGASAQRDLDHARARLDSNSLELRADIIFTIGVGLLLLAFVARARSQLLRDLARQNVMLEERVRERTATLEARNSRIETMLQDVSHRVGNALSLVTGFLDLQARASKSDEVKDALASARQRVFSIASAQRRMRLAMDSDSVEAGEFFGALVEDFRTALPDHRITITASIARGSIPSQDASSFGVILNELIANAIKHAWRPTDIGELSVRFALVGDERVLTVRDDGRGDFREDSSGGLGQILVKSLVQSLNGEMTTAPVGKDPERPGLECTVRAPA